MEQKNIIKNSQIQVKGEKSENEPLVKMKPKVCLIKIQTVFTATINKNAKVMTCPFSLAGCRQRVDFPLYRKNLFFFDKLVQ